MWKKKKGNIDGKGGYSSVRRVVDQLELRPWPFEDRTGTREVVVAYVAPAKFDDPLPEKSNAKHRVAIDREFITRDWDIVSFFFFSKHGRLRSTISDRAISGLVQRKLSR